MYKKYEQGELVSAKTRKFSVALYEEDINVTEFNNFRIYLSRK